MKYFLALFAITGLITTGVSSQQQSGDQGCRRAGPPPMDPFLQLFDTDRDGEISSQELAQSEAVLKKLDWDQNGKLTRDELPRPPQPDAERGQRHKPESGRGPHLNAHHRHRPEPRPHHGPHEGGPADHRPGQGRPPRPDAERLDQREPAPGLQDAAASTVIFNGGYETDPRDHGRPVALIAAALGVKDQVFRDAFSNVNPAPFGAPSAARARANKDVLMKALGKYGITNERLDEVSNYYRYQPGRGKLWKHTPAQATAIIKEGKVTGIKIINPGSGYLTTPQVSIAGFPDVRIKATLAFGKNLNTNGTIQSLTIED